MDQNFHVSLSPAISLQFFDTGKCCCCPVVMASKKTISQKASIMEELAKRASAHVNLDFSTFCVYVALRLPSKNHTFGAQKEPSS